MKIRYVYLLLVGLWLGTEAISQEEEIKTIAYVGSTDDQIEDTSISKVKNPDISDFQGSYHFGTSEEESQFEIIYSNNRLFARTKSGQWKDENWIFIYERDPITYKNGKIIVGNIHFELYECIEEAYGTLQVGDRGLVMESTEELNGTTTRYLQFSLDTKLEKEDGQFPEASFVKLTTKDLEPFSKDELTVMRNEILARKGYIFKAGGKMSKFFMKQDWYTSLSKTKKVDLSNIERHNIRMIKEVENTL